MRFKLLPLIFSQIYLTLTLFIFFYGPITYHLEDRLSFITYIIFYHLMMIAGFILGIKLKFKFRSSSDSVSNLRSSFWKISFLALFASLVANSNLTMTGTLIPNNIIKLISSGFSFETIGTAYFDKILAFDTYSGNKYLNIILLFISWSKIVYITYIVEFWDNLSIIKKCLALLIVSIPLLSGISTGTNKPVFDFAFFLSISLFLFFIKNKIFTGRYNLPSRRNFILVLFIGFIFSIFFFNSAMQGRGVDLSFIETTANSGEITVKRKFLSNENFVPYVMLSSYLVQGYYGFSIALSQPFSSTFGFGNSPFLTRQYEWVTGNDLHTRTYQFKIDSKWGETSQWHSAYSQFANDFHFVGVGFFLFFMFFLMAISWKLFIRFGDLHAQFLIPLFFIFIIYLPANNQVFGYVETFSAFWLLTIIILLKIKTDRYV